MQGFGDFLKGEQRDVGMLKGFDVGDHLLRGVKLTGQFRLADALFLSNFGNPDGEPGPHVFFLKGSFKAWILELSLQPVVKKQFFALHSSVSRLFEYVRIGPMQVGALFL